MSTHTCVLTATTFDGRPSRPCEACAAGVNNYVDGREAGLREALEVAERLGSCSGVDIQSELRRRLGLPPL